MEIDIEKLIKEAIEARERAYCPYSNFAVGAALLVGSGEIYRGCNAENASYPAGICAERCAMFKAVSEGHGDFAAIAIVGGRKGEASDTYAYPCGICRQVMSEWAGKDFKIIVAKSCADYKVYSLEELLPESFKL